MQEESILSTLHTTDDRDDILTLIDTMISFLYTNDTSLFSFIHTNVPASISGYFVANLEPLADTESKEKWLKALRERISLLEIIDLALAFHPSRASLERMSQVIKRVYEKQLLMRISFNPDLIAGVEVIYKGAYRDMSARTRFSEVMQSMKGKI